MNAAVLDLIGLALAALGGVLLLAAGIGLVRLPGVLERMHAARLAETIAPSLVLGGLAVASGRVDMALKLALLAVVIALFGAFGAMALAGAARTAAAEPIDPDIEAGP